MSEDLKRCSRCDNEKLMKNFHKKPQCKDGKNPICKSCRKHCHNENLVKIKKCFVDNRDQKLINQIHYYSENYDKIIARKKIFCINRYKTDNNFRLICRTRSITHHALNGKSKSISTKEILGIDLDTYRKWIQFQMTPDMNRSNIEADHVKPICLFDIFENEELREAFNWKKRSTTFKKWSSAKRD